MLPYSFFIIIYFLKTSTGNITVIN